MYEEVCEMLTESPSVLECITARETFLRAYQEAAKEPTRSRELCIRLALDAVWTAGREYQMRLDGVCAALHE